MSSGDEWSTPSNEALLLSLVSPSGTRLETFGHQFHPRFTYSIFGDSEEIFGYRDLEINLRYNASDMRPNLTINYSKKFKAVGDTEAADIERALREYLPDVAFQKAKEFELAIKNVNSDWTPPGELAASFSAHGNAFEIWKGNLVDPAVKQLVKRIQILVPLFIEGGSKIEMDGTDADRWTVFFLYQKKASTVDAGSTPYVFAGYCTVYRFFFMRLPSPPPSPSESEVERSTLNQDFDLSQLPCRSRISQFLILPPFQGKGLGPTLYNTIYQEYITHPPTFEITVEDPNEAFDDLRDIADLHYLRKLPEFQALHINKNTVIPQTGPAPRDIVDRAAYDAARAKAKMVPRQFARVLEMHLLSQLPSSVRADLIAPNEDGKDDGAGAEKQPTPDEEHEYRLWKLLLKKRLYRQNMDALGELEIPERIAKLDETVASVEFDYERLLIKAAEHETNWTVAHGNAGGKRNAQQQQEKKTDGAAVARGAAGGTKRKTTVEDDDEEPSLTTMNKKARVKN